MATIGIFDGVHTGHRFILDHLKTQANTWRGIGGGDLVAPSQLVLNRDLQNFKLLHTREEKIRELESHWN